MEPFHRSGTHADARFFGWITRLVHAHRRQLVALAQREGLNADDALDCVQEAFQSFLLLPQARRLVDEPEESIKLLSVVARNVARNQRRRHHRARPHDDEATAALPDVTDPPDVIVERAESYVAAIGCMATLGEVQKAVVELRLVDEVPGEDVAAILGISPAHVAVLLHRAKRKLRACIVDAEGH
jgi:RNA polymerase sigma-70 factor (ECF subfamily)